MKYIILIILVASTISPNLYASCNDISELNSVTLSSGQIFKYRFLKGTNPNQPTVIFLPGGPGQGSIDNEDPRLSKSYNFIQTDPRGVGCNKDLYDPNINLSSEDLAKDIVALIKKEAFDNYIIYGLSYGTALATIVAHNIESDPEIPNPKSLVLEGVLGRAFETHEENQGTLTEWAKYKEQAILLDLFKQAEPTLGFNTFEIGQFIKELLSYGLNPYNPDYYLIESYFNLLQQSDESHQILIDTIKGSTQAYDINLIRLYRQIDCEEFTSLGWKHDFHFKNGELILKDSERGICNGFKFTQGFDSSLYPLTTKTYYFNGTNDPATPIWQANYHIQNQKRSFKNIINVIGGGHNSLSYSLEDCLPQVWEKILSNQTITQDLLNTNCALKTQVQSQ